MKTKNILLISAISLTAFSAQSRLYVGAGAAYVNSASTIKLTGTVIREVGSATMVNNSSAVAPRFFAGYEKDNNNCFWGVEAFGSFSDIKSQNKLDFVGGDAGTQALLTSPTVKYSRNYLLGVRAKIGGYVSDNLSAFAALGIIGSQFKMKYTDINMFKSFNKTVVGIEPGVGVSYKFNSKWRLGFDYFYQQYATFSKTYENTVQRYSATMKSKFKFNTFMASISYIM
jgi:hypothetical protein